ncbi:MAG: isoprenyl transferase [Nitrospinae bacterium]|nr:isoprenyl transferase [Nitrospinota bacterium]
MDGNGRWAKRRMMPRIFGHRAGVATVDRILSLASEIKLPALTLYSFSTENWKRPPTEVAALMDILKEYLMKEMMRMVQNNIRFNTIGRIAELPAAAIDCINQVKESTKNNTGTVLTLALSYGGRAELEDAVKAIAREVKSGGLDPEAIGQETIGSHLDTAGLPEVDLLIRTSGEQRISNFLLWQIAYAELWFTDILWPDFQGTDFLQAVREFQKRERRFGLSGDQLGPLAGGSTA